MKEIIVHSGFHPEIKREYNGEHIHKVLYQKAVALSNPFHPGPPDNKETVFYRLDNNAWIKDLGEEKYETDWTSEERWGRVEEIEYDNAGKIVSQKDLGFMILRVDRSRGIL